jgi:DNA-binding MarR family transcriptional regulator
MQPKSDDPGYRLTVAVLKAADALLRASQKLLRPYGLTAAQFNVLNLIARNESGMSQRELGDKLVVDRSNVTGLLDRMEKAGWVRRGDDPDDRRIYRVSLTPLGRRQWEKANARYVAAVEKVTQSLSADQMLECVGLLEELTQASAEWTVAPEARKAARSRRSPQG